MTREDVERERLRLASWWVARCGRPIPVGAGEVLCLLSAGHAGPCVIPRGGR